MEIGKPIALMICSIAVSPAPISREIKTESEDKEMAKYTADNNKVVDTDKMERVLDLDYEGSYGTVRRGLYRTKKSHNWYRVSESSWSGCGNISDAEALDCEAVSILLAEEMDEEEISERYPEISEYLQEAIDE